VFTIFDTSNLINYIGALNLVVAASQVLSNDTSATNHTEELLRPDDTCAALFHEPLGCPLPTINLLSGLIPADPVTNVSALPSSGDTVGDVAHHLWSGKALHSVQTFTAFHGIDPLHESHLTTVVTFRYDRFRTGRHSSNTLLVVHEHFRGRECC
jgi:hypothetical protein